MKQFYVYCCQLVACIITLLFSSHVTATTFPTPTANNSLLGEIQYTTADANDSTATLAQRYNLGLNSVVNANPGVAENSLLQNAGNLTVSTAFILPPVPRKGIIINLPEMRMYYFPAGTDTVMTFPIGIGRIGKTIPIENTVVVRKVTNPTWFPTPDIREFNRKQGIDLPKEMGPGPDNPLGPYAIYLRIPTYLIHSTIFPESIGRRASFGCIRMNESDIKEFFPLVTAGTPVAIIDMPAKVGWDHGRLYLQAYPPLQERTDLPHAKLSGVVELVQQSIPAHSHVFINWQMVAYITEQPDGIPHEIGFKLQN
jgi:L,D-transpeptidase ErfK/SrfK